MPRAGQELLDLVDDRLPVPDPGQVILAFELDILRSLGARWARYRLKLTGTMLFSRWRISVGTEILGRAARTSTSFVARSAAIAMPGLAQMRSALPKTCMEPGTVVTRWEPTAPSRRSRHPIVGNAIQEELPQGLDLRGLVGQIVRRPEPLRRRSRAGSSASHRSGYVAANSIDGTPPSENPQQGGVLETDGIHDHSDVLDALLGRRRTRDGIGQSRSRLVEHDQPQNEVMRRNIAFACGSLHISAMCETIPLDRTRSIGPSPTTW